MRYFLAELHPTVCVSEPGFVIDQEIAYCLYKTVTPLYTMLVKEAMRSKLLYFELSFSVGKYYKYVPLVLKSSLLNTSVNLLKFHKIRHICVWLRTKMQS